MQSTSCFLFFPEVQSMFHCPALIFQQVNLTLSFCSSSSFADDLCLPTYDQVHIPQIRHFGEHREARRALHPPPQHCQREDIHLHLVLAPLPGRPQFSHPGLQGGHTLLSLHQGIRSQNAVSESKAGMHRNGEFFFHDLF